jgi:hypothetical protein
VHSECRSREILALKQGTVRSAAGLLFLADTKTGRKSVILNAPTVLVLTSLAGRRTCRPCMTENERARRRPKPARRAKPGSALRGHLAPGSCSFGALAVLAHRWPYARV